MKETAALLSDIAQTDETLQAAHNAAQPMLPAMLFCFAHYIQNHYLCIRIRWLRKPETISKIIYNEKQTLKN